MISVIIRVVTKVERLSIRGRNTCNLVEFWREQHEMSAISELRVLTEDVITEVPLWFP